jgi:hypothetical protein
MGITTLNVKGRGVRERGGRGRERKNEGGGRERGEGDNMEGGKGDNEGGGKGDNEGGDTGGRESVREGVLGSKREGVLRPGHRLLRWVQIKEFIYFIGTQKWVTEVINAAHKVIPLHEASSCSLLIRGGLYSTQAAAVATTMIQIKSV